MGLEGEVVCLVAVECELDGNRVEVCDMFRREGHPAGLSEELGVHDLLRVDKRQHHEVDANKFGVLLSRYTKM